MKLLFLILAHDRPEDTATLARTLVAAATDARALIHFDAQAKPETFAALQAVLAADPETAPRIGLVEKRVACRWGSFGLVEAPLNALAQAEAEGQTPDYVILLSGACLPCRPVAELERFLSENAGREFIESEDEGWVTGGWRSERWRFWHVFDHKTQNIPEMVSARVQAALRVRRRFPAGLSPRFGSQWWALTWPAVQAILADVRQNPKRLDFFRTVWIPDEMVIQTYVWALVPHGAIAGFGLTHFQFTNRGKPLVFHEDHADYIRTLDRFFFRKISPEAKTLRAACLARASEPDGGGSLARIGARQDHYMLKMRAQTHYPPTGALFYRDQFTDQSMTVLGRAKTPYVVLLGPPALTRRLADALTEPQFLTLGAVFARDAVDFGPGRESFGGLRRSDTAIRDQHPALWLVRVRKRAAEEGRVPVILWSPTEQANLLANVMRDPAALVIALTPRSGDPARDRVTLLSRCLGPARMRPSTLPLGLPPALLREAVFEGASNGPDMALWLVSGVAPKGAPDLRQPDMVLTWGGARDPARRAARRATLQTALETSRFRDAPWFPAIAETLGQIYARKTQDAPERPQGRDEDRAPTRSGDRGGDRGADRGADRVEGAERRVSGRKDDGRAGKGSGRRPARKALPDEHADGDADGAGFASRVGAEAGAVDQGPGDPDTAVLREMDPGVMDPGVMDMGVVDPGGVVTGRREMGAEHADTQDMGAAEAVVKETEVPGAVDAGPEGGQAPLSDSGPDAGSASGSDRDPDAGRTGPVSPFEAAR